MSIDKKKGLGRGLGALIENAYERNEPVHEIVQTVAPSTEIELSKIEVNPFQPRREFDPTALQELSDSIKQLGIIQPITVRKIGDDQYQLISGERRMRASHLAGLTAVPAFVREANDQEMLEMALVENIQREELNPIEIAISYQRLIDECHLTQEQLSERVGKQRSTVTNYLRMLRLQPEIQLGLKNKVVTIGHARPLLALDDPTIQMDTYAKVVNEGLSVRKVEELVKLMQNPPQVVETVVVETVVIDKGNVGNDIPTEPKQENHFTELRDLIASHFQTKVELQKNNIGKGKIVINFNTEEEFERVIGIFDRLKQ